MFNILFNLPIFIQDGNHHRQQPETHQQFCFYGVPLTMFFSPNDMQYSNNVPFSNLFDNVNMSDFANQSFQQYQQDQINKKAPTKKNALESLPTYKLSPLRKQIMTQCGEHCDQSCAVCICDFEECDELIRLPCGHVFHKDCVSTWLNEHNTCPTCRYELPTEDIEKESIRLKKMKERFGGDDGVKVFDIATKIENVLSRVDQFVSDRENNKSSTVVVDSNQILKQLTRFDGELMNLTIELDSIEFKESNWIRNQRKMQIVKIQAILSVLDQIRAQIVF